MAKITFMSSTITDIELSQPEAELIIADGPQKPRRRSALALDDKYIKAFCDLPQKGKAAAYRKASGDSGPYHRQRANDMHRRLQSEIDERLRDMALGSANYGLNVLYDLTENSKDEKLRAACASKLLDFGLRFAPPDKLKERPVRSREELLLNIEATKARIELLESGG